MEYQNKIKNITPRVEVITKTSDLQKLYSERIERFMSLVELSYALKNSTRIIQKK